MTYNEKEIRDRVLKLSRFMSRREKEILNRTIEEAIFIIDKNATLRETAKHFGKVAKSTVQVDVSVRLWYYFPKLAEQVSSVLFVNSEESLIRATVAKKCKKWEDKVLRKQGAMHLAFLF